MRKIGKEWRAAKGERSLQNEHRCVSEERKEANGRERKRKERNEWYKETKEMKAASERAELVVVVDVRQSESETRVGSAP